MKIKYLVNSIILLSCLGACEKKIETQATKSTQILGKWYRTNQVTWLTQFPATTPTKDTLWSYPGEFLEFKSDSILTTCEYINSNYFYEDYRYFVSKDTIFILEEYLGDTSKNEIQEISNKKLSLRNLYYGPGELVWNNFHK